MNSRFSGRLGGIVWGVAIMYAVALTQQGQAVANAMNVFVSGAMSQSCAKSCSDCQRACDMCASHCTRMLEAGKKEHLQTLATCQDCATTCSAAAQIVSPGGPFSKTICTACADTCVKCSKECEKFPQDEMMKQCAAECSKCELACREMLKMAESSK